jgi:hypothetical protein
MSINVGNGGGAVFAGSGERVAGNGESVGTFVGGGASDSLKDADAALAPPVILDELAGGAVDTRVGSGVGTAHAVKATNTTSESSQVCLNIFPPP